jgi:hypothetical protein
MMMTVSLAGCFGGDDGDSNEETPIVTLDDWQVHFANSASDLPECNDDRGGWLFYVGEDENFQVCTQSTSNTNTNIDDSVAWHVIDIMGADAISPSQQINAAKQDATNMLIQSCGTTIQDAQNVVNIVVDESRGDGNLDNSNQIVDTGSNANMMEIRIESELNFADIDKACVMDTADELYDELLELEDYFGQDGVAGVDGNDGAQGLPGVNGINGLSILINAVDSTTCLNGGKTFEIGNDGNFDNILDVSEVKTSVEICNGEQGPAGADGQDGADGTNGTDGQDGADGTNGTDGQDGADGTNGTDGQDVNRAFPV